MPRGVFRPIIRFAKSGCVNRPFYVLVATDPDGPNFGPFFETLGSLDPMPNKNGEKLVGLNFERIQHWLISGAYISRNAKDILGLSGFLPLTPRCLQQARRKQIVASLRERVAAGETLSEEDIPIIVKYHKYNPIYEKTFEADSYGHETSLVDYNEFENKYQYHSIWSDKFKELTKDFDKGLDE